jgi:hypothetical protein
MNETPTNEPPHPPIIAQKPGKIVPATRRVTGERRPHQNLAQHGLVPIPDVEESAKQ